MAHPPSRLRDYPVGTRVKLIGAMTEGLPPFFITAENEDGYRYLSKTEDGKWQQVACGSHRAQKVDQ